jgi:hypothetical protein
VRARSELGAGLWLVLGLLLVGVVLGVAWALVAPGLPTVVAADGTTAAVNPESRSRFDPVALFVLSGLVVGLLSGALSWLWRRWRGTVVLVAVVAGSLASASVAEVVGLVVANLRYSGGVGSAAVGSTVVSAPELGTWTPVLAQPFGAALAYALAVAFTGHADLGRPPEAPVSGSVSGDVERFG